MHIYVFGNKDDPNDTGAIVVAQKLSKSLPAGTFIYIKPNEDVPFSTNQDIVIMDVVEGLTDVQVLSDTHIKRIVLAPRTTVHDFDLGFQLRYLKKLGKLGKVTLIGLPKVHKPTYSKIQSIFKKLVAQDIHGS